jgi:YD repeat-containing protein
MTTYTYSPLIGITSTCSDNNAIQRYDYDAMGRLTRIIDQDGNIIKTAEYHYQNQVGQ